MGDGGEDLEPLFDYRRVQPLNVVCLDDDDSDTSTAPSRKRAKKTSETVVEKVDKDVKVIKIVGDEDWLPPPPKVTTNEDKQSGEDSTIKELRLKKQELLSFAKSAEDVLREVEESAEGKVDKSSDSSLEVVAGEPPKPPLTERVKIVISIQDKDGQKQFRVYTDDKFEKLFEMYTDRAKLDLQRLVFCFDGDKINPSDTPDSLGMEDDDMIEVHMKKS